MDHSFFTVGLVMLGFGGAMVASYQIGRISAFTEMLKKEIKHDRNCGKSNEG
jgi:hypothetical protein